MSVEKKVEIVQAYIRRKICMAEAARRGTVNEKTMESWVRNYEAELMDMIHDYIAYCNNRRVQRNLGILTPAKKHEQFYLAA